MKYFPPMSLRRKALAFPFAVLLVALGTAGCQSKEAPKEADSHDHDHDFIHVTAEQRDLAGMVTGRPENAPVHQYLDVTGMADVPPESLADISAPLGGFVKTAPFYEGATVKKGQVLVSLEHPEYIRLQQEFLEAHSQFLFLETDIQRQEALYKGEAASQKNYQQTKAAYEMQKTRRDGLAASLRVAGLYPEHILNKGIQQRVNLTAPFDGIISMVDVNLGKQVGPEEILYQMYDPKHMHVELQVYPKDLPKIVKGQKIQYKVQGTASWSSGHIVLIGGAVNPDTRTVRVHAHPDERDAHLKPGAYIQARIALSTDSLLALPLGAVVKEEGKSYVFVEKPGGFQRVAVKELTRTDTHVALAEYPEGKLVTKGAYYLVAVEEEGHEH